jgi:hypothetical protein
MTKSFFRLMMLIALALFVGVFLYAIEIDKHNRPPEGLHLPAGVAGGKPVLKGAGAARNPLAAQHMTSGEMARMLSDIVAESLSFTKSTFTYNSLQAEKYFTPAGYAQYKEFLTKAGFEGALASGELQSAAYAEQEALEITRGVFGGVFKWLFEVPVTISFIPVNADTYRDGGIKPENRRILLRVQFTRVEDANDPQAVKIEGWQVLPPRKF